MPSLTTVTRREPGNIVSSDLIRGSDGPIFAGIPLIENASILTPTGGFLAPGYTHTINVYQGCAFAGALCGLFCYAQHNRWITRGRTWGLYGAKRRVREAYRRDFDRIKRPKRGEPGPLRIYMSSSTDPYIPQEKSLRLTRAPTIRTGCSLMWSEP